MRVKSCVKGHVSMPTIPELRFLLSQPHIRDLIPTKTIDEDLNDKQILGLLIQSTGVTVPPERACTHCRLNLGPFPDCVRVALATSALIESFAGHQTSSCGNCLLFKHGSHCSIKHRKLSDHDNRDDEITGVPAPDNVPCAGSPTLPDTPGMPSTPDSLLRRSVRLAIVASRITDRAEDKTKDESEISPCQKRLRETRAPKPVTPSKPKPTREPKTPTANTPTEKIPGSEPTILSGRRPGPLTLSVPGARKNENAEDDGDADAISPTPKRRRVVSDTPTTPRRTLKIKTPRQIPEVGAAASEHLLVASATTPRRRSSNRMGPLQASRLPSENDVRMQEWERGDGEWWDASGEGELTAISLSQTEEQQETRKYISANQP
jgi:hypothetical protein